MMFSNAKVDDRVWSARNGWGAIKRIEQSDNTKQLCIVFDCGYSYWYYNNGKYIDCDLYPELYWDEIKITPPPKPKRMVKKTVEGWVRKTISNSPGAMVFSQFTDDLTIGMPEDIKIYNATLTYEVEEDS